VMGYYEDGSWEIGEWALMLAMMVLFWGLLAAAVVWIVRSTSHRDETGGDRALSATASAREVLSERFARGEIDEEEFLRRRELLHRSPGPSR
jgi:putative membrane protein